MSRSPPGLRRKRSQIDGVMSGGGGHFLDLGLWGCNMLDRLHFHDIDYNRVAFPGIDILERGRTFSGFWREENSDKKRFVNGQIRGKKGCYRFKCCFFNIQQTAPMTLRT